MLRDLIVVGAGPVGATLALALADSDLDVVTLDARATGSALRADRSLALSHGARLIFERLGVWSALAATPGAVTPITAVDVSQRGGFGHVRLEAAEHSLPALGYIVGYRALQSALDAALARRGAALHYDCAAERVSVTPAYASIEAKQGGEAIELSTRLVALADGGGELIGAPRRSHDYQQVAVIAKLTPREPHRGIAFERFTPEGPMALLPDGDRYGLVWTTKPERAETLLALPEAEFLTALDLRIGASAPGGSIPGGFERVADRRSFPLRLEYASRVTRDRCVLLGNAAQALHPVAGQGLNLGLRDAYELAQELLSTPRDAIGSRAALAAYARRRSADRLSGIAFTHGLLSVFGTALPLVSWPRGLALTMLDCVPPLKRAFTRAMLFGA
jgi:2-octaprenyl-6-methoxyphenol hydroxylase